MSAVAGDPAARVAAFEGLLAELVRRGLDAKLLAEARRQGDGAGAAIRRARAEGVATDLASARLARVCESHAGGLAKLVGKSLPAPGEHRPEAAGTTLPGVELLVELARLAPASDPVRAANDMVVQAIVAAAKVFHDGFMRQIEGVDAIDMRRAAADLMRLDILLWLLEILKADEAGRCVRQQSQIVARGALRRARRVADAYLARRGPQERFDLATVVAEVEELGVLVTRVIEAGKTRRADDLADDLGRRSVREFLHAMGKVVLAAFRDLDERLEAGTLSEAVLAGSLKKIANVRSLCRSVRIDDADTVLIAVERVIARKAVALGVVLVRRRAEPGMARLMAILTEFLDCVEAVRHQPR